MTEQIRAEEDHVEAVSQPRMKHKSFTYSTQLTWTSGVSGVISSAEKPSLTVSSPPEFRGEAGVWTPEDLFVASVEICNMTTFLSFARRRGLRIVSYQSSAKGTLEFVQGAYRFTRIALFPTINVASPTTEEDVRAVLAESHDHCLVANSISTAVDVTPHIVVQ